MANGLARRRFLTPALTKPLRRPSLLIRLLLGIQCMGFCDEGATEEDLRSCWMSCGFIPKVIKEKCNDEVLAGCQDNVTGLFDHGDVQLCSAATEMVAKRE